MTTKTVSIATTAGLPVVKDGLLQRKVLQALSAMPHGNLFIELPDGRCLSFGANGLSRWHEKTMAPAALAVSETAHIKVIRPSFFSKCVLYGDIGFAESYLDGDWETPSLTAVIAWFILNLEHSPTLSGSKASALGLNLLRGANRLWHLIRPNSRTQARRNIQDHYDLSNDFFRLWLDPSMMYSSARWEKQGASLEQAQWAKNEALCQKLQLQPSDRVLEIGSGWGSWSLHAASRFGCKVTTITLSRAQFELARERIAQAGLQDRIELRLEDYRDLPTQEQYDKIVSIEMLEAVGHRYLPEWARVVSRALRPSGLMALQFITCPDSRYGAFRSGVDFIQKHIFPGSLLLSVNRLNALLSENGGFVLHSLEDAGQDYAKTLAVWRENFLGKLDEVRGQGFDERFLRKWHYYLAYCEAAFALRNISVVQTVHTRPNNLSFA
jgi:cyclopropane-fatty-acyl-phospholipid synthase